MRLILASICVALANSHPSESLSSTPANPASPPSIHRLSREWEMNLLAIASPGPPEDRGRERFLLRRRFGKNGPVLVGLSFGAAQLLPVKAGRPMPGLPPRERPRYTDAFGLGLHGALEAAFTFRPILSLLCRAGFELFPGKTRTEGVLGRVRYSDMWIFPVHIGLRLGAPLSLPVSVWLEQDFSPVRKGTRPFLEVLIGMAHRTRVDLKPAGAYWREALVFSATAGAGIEVRFGKLGVLAGAGFTYHSEPPERVWYAEPEAAMAVTLMGGMSLRF